VTLLKEKRTALISESNFVKPPALIPSLSASAIDPFGTLPVDNSRLQMLLDDGKKLIHHKGRELVF
jgi:hypothetical protein